MQKSPPKKTSASLVGRLVILRARDAGCCAGILRERTSSSTAVLDSCRQLYRWHTSGRGSIYDVAYYGCETLEFGPPSDGREVIGFCDILVPVAEAEASLKGHFND